MAGYEAEARDASARLTSGLTSGLEDTSPGGAATAARFAAVATAHADAAVAASPGGGGGGIGGGAMGCGGGIGPGAADGDGLEMWREQLESACVAREATRRCAMDPAEPGP